jgi:N-methylhydantoinase B
VNGGFKNYPVEVYESKCPPGGLFGGKDAIGTGGGGGYGNAWERDPHLVREDVIDGYVTREGAKRDYGVVLKEDLSIDKKATQKRRKAMQKRVA